MTGYKLSFYSVESCAFALDTDLTTLYLTTDNFYYMVLDSYNYVRQVLVTSETLKLGNEQKISLCLVHLHQRSTNLRTFIIENIRINYSYIIM